MEENKDMWDNLAPLIRRDVGARIREIREMLGMSQSELGESIGRRQAYISEIETGKTEPTLLALIQFSFAFNKPVEYLLPMQWRNVTGDDPSVTTPNLSVTEQDLINTLRTTHSYEHKMIAIHLIKSLIDYYEKSYESRFPDATQTD